MPGKNFNKKRQKAKTEGESAGKKPLPPAKPPLNPGELPALPPFTVKWSGRRRSIGLTVTLAGELVVSAPVGTALAAISRAVARHREWIEAKMAAGRLALSRLQPARAYYLGRAWEVCVIGGRPPKVELTGDCLTLRQPEPQADPWPQLAAWYRAQAGPYLVERVRHFAGLMGLKVGALELCDWRARWGECHPTRGLLRFNWRLILLPPDLVDYVVAHELTHLLVPGHPPAFWQRLGEVMPDWPHRRRRLNQEASPFLRWRWEGGGGG